MDIVCLVYFVVCLVIIQIFQGQYKTLYSYKTSQIFAVNTKHCIPTRLVKFCGQYKTLYSYKTSQILWSIQNAVFLAMELQD